MSGDKTPNLDLEYLAPSQAQPEVLINDAWNKLDAFAGEQSGITVADADSPFTSVAHVKTLRVAGGSVTAESDGVALLTIEGGGPGTTSTPGLIIPGRRGDRGRAGRPGLPGGAGAAGAAGATGANGIGRPLGAYFVVPGGGTIILPVNAVETVVQNSCTIQEILVLTKGGVGSCTLKLWKANISAHYPPIVTDDITGGANVVISSGTTHQDSTLTGWSKTLLQDDVILVTLSATSGFSSIGIYIRVG